MAEDVRADKGLTLIFSRQLSPSKDASVFWEATPEGEANESVARLQLREAIAKASGETGGWQNQLSERPFLENAGVSISHCPGRMGFALTSNFKSIGFDIEKLDRLKTKTIERVSTKEELSAAPQIEGLWVAKEAAYKALSNYDQRFEELTISQIILKEWSPPASIHGLSEVRGFKALVMSSALGLTFNGYFWTDGEYAFALCFGPAR